MARAKNIDPYSDLLRHVHLRNTPARRAVLAWFDKATGPQSHADLVIALSKEGFDRATLYRNLRELERAGLLCRSDMGDRCWRFERTSPIPDKLSEQHGAHAHFVCVDCGEVVCMPKLQLDVAHVMRYTSTRPERIEINVHGQCRQCC